MDVKLPNGRVIRGVPDGTPKEEVARKAIAAGLALEADFPGIGPEPGMFSGATEGLGDQIAEAPGLIARGLGQAALDEVGRRPEFGELTPRQGLESFKEDVFRRPARAAAESLRQDDVAAQERVQEAMPREAGIVAQGLRSGAQSLVEQAPGAVLSAVTRNPAWMLANIGATSGGRSYGQARAEGLEIGEAQNFAAIQTGIELLTEYLPAKSFAKVFGAAGKDGAGQVLRFIREEMVGEQIATLLQSANEVAYGLDEELGAALEARDVGAVADITARRAAITAVATAAAGGGQIALGKVADRVAGTNDSGYIIGEELARQLESGEASPAAASDAFRDDRVTELKETERLSRRLQERRARVLEEADRRAQEAPRALPNPNPARADFQVDPDGATLATGGESREASEQALFLGRVQENRRRRASEEIIERTGERSRTDPRGLPGPSDFTVDQDGTTRRVGDPDALPNPNRAEADFIGSGSEVAPASRMDEIRRTPADEAVRDEPRARVVGRTPTESQRLLPNPNASGADFITGPDGTSSADRIDDRRLSRDARARMQARTAQDEAQAPLPRETVQAPEPHAASPTEVDTGSAGPKPKMVRAKRASEQFGVDKGGTLVATPDGREVLLWKDDGTDMWNVSFPSDQRLPDITNRTETRMEVVAEIQSDLDGMMARERDYVGRPVFEQSETEQATEQADDTPDEDEFGDAVDAEFTEPGPAPSGDVVRIPFNSAIFDEIEGLSQTIERSARIVEGDTGIQLEMDREDAELALAELEDADGGPMLLSTINALDEGIRRPREAAPARPAPRPAARATRADVEFTAGRNTVEQLQRISDTFRDRARVSDDPEPQVSMSEQDADAILDDLRGVTGRDKKVAKRAMKRIERAMGDVSFAQVVGEPPVDIPIGATPTQEVSAAVDRLLEASADLDGMDLFALRSNDADMVEPTRAEIAEVKSAFQDLVNAGMPIELIESAAGSFLVFEDYTKFQHGIFLYESSAVGVSQGIVNASLSDGSWAKSLRQTLAHEIGHAIDRDSDNDTWVSRRHFYMDANLGTGDITARPGTAASEVLELRAGGGEVGDAFSYPIDFAIEMLEAGESPGNVNGFLTGESFAQAFAMAYTARGRMSAELPKTLEAVQEIVNEVSEQLGVAAEPGTARSSGVPSDVRGADPDGADAPGGIAPDRSGEEDPDGNLGRSAPARDDGGSEGGQPLASRSRGRPVPAGDPEAISVIPLLRGSESLDIEGNPTLERVARALQLRTEASGLDLSEQTEENQDRIAEILALETEEALGQDGNAATWYRDTVDRAIAVASRIHPEISTNRNSRSSFMVALAITSNGQDVASNVKFAERAYASFKEGGRMPEDLDAGKESQSINASMRLYNRLLDRLGPTNTRVFLESEYTLKELQEAGFKVTGDTVDTTTHGSAIFGPKIGGGFYQNLMGNWDPITMDRWFMRTWGRVTGTIMQKEPARALKLRDGMRGELERAGKSVPRTDPELDLLAKQLHDKFKRKDPTTGKTYSDRSPLNRAAKNLDGFLRDPKDAPAGARERKYIRQTMVRVLEKLRERGHDLDTASVQALLWYPEKQLYTMHGVGNKKAEPTDYEQEFKALARRRGVSERSLSGAIGGANRRRRRLEGNEGGDGRGSVRDRGAQPGPVRSEQASRALDRVSRDSRGAGRASRNIGRSLGAGSVREDAGSDRRGADQGGDSVPSYGEPVEGAVSVRARHYSQRQREQLSGSFFGQGLRGDERKRLAGAPQELRDRIHFYVDDGAGITPESGVGSVPHEVQLNNIYDSRSALIESGMLPNEFELEVIRRGFDGYMAKFGRQRAVVLLGTKHTSVPVAQTETEPTAAAAPAQAPSGKPREIPLGDVSAARNVLAQIQELDPEAAIQWGHLRVAAEHADAALEILGGNTADRPTAAASRGRKTYQQALEDGGLMTQPGPSTSRFNLDDETRVQRFLRIIHDKMLRLKVAQKKITDDLLLDDLPDDINAYRKEELFHGKVSDDIRALEEKHVERVAGILSREGLSRGELDLFLYAKHAPERNAYIQRERDPSNSAGSGMTNAEARDVLQKAKNEGRTQGLTRAARAVYDMLEENRSRMEAAGLLDSSTVTAWRSEYQNYVPLKGFAALDLEPISRTGRGFAVGGKETMAAAGRRTLADSPFLNAIQDSTEKIVRARKNEVAQAFLGLAEQHADPTMWKVYDASKSGTLPKERVVINGRSVERPIDPARAVRVDNGEPRFFQAKRDGKTFYVEIKDPLLNRAMHNAGVEKLNGATEFLVTYVGWATRQLSALNTTLNPEFFVVNAVRDIQAAVFNMFAEQQRVDGKAKGKEVVQGMMKDYVPSLRAFWRGVRGAGPGKSKRDKELDRYYTEFREDGAMTGWAMSLSVEQEAKRIERLARLAGTGAWAKTERAARKSLETVEDLNLAIENAVRLSAYANAREQGLSRDQAASLAKNLTVNFNRRGEMTTVANSLYMFFNAAVQGNYQLVRSLANDPRTIGGLTMAQKAAAGMVVSGVGLTLMNAMLSDIDDDEESFYAKIPDWEKERNLIIMSPADGRSYAKIPLPYGYNIFHVAGVSVAEAFLEQRSPAQAGWMMLHSLFDSFSPIGLPSSEDGGVAARGFAPTLTQPFLDLAVNENHFGSPIMRENFPTGTQSPDSSMSMRSTTEAAKALAQFLNSISGGEKNVDGAVDISPDAIEHVVGFATGGLGRFALRSYNFGEKTATGGDLEMRDIPFLRQIAGEPSKWEDMGLYFDRRYDIEQVVAEYDARTGRSKLDWLHENRSIILLADVVKDTEAELRDVRKTRRELEQMTRTDAVDRALENNVEAEFRQYTRLNRAHNRATKDQ